MTKQPTLILVHETEAACVERLLGGGFRPDRASEISSYLAQSTDLAPEFDALEAACRAVGLGFRPLALDAFADSLPGLQPDSSLVWTLTDGIAYFRGGAAPAMARLRGLPVFGSDDSLFALCQDKFRAGAVLAAFGLPCPAAGLARNGAWLVQPPASAAGWFVKPNRLGAKIGIWTDSHCHDLQQALDLSRRVFEAYRDDVIVQPYVAGRNARASFLATNPQTGIDALGVSFVDSGTDFQTMQDSLALYGDTGVAAKAAGRYTEPELSPVRATQPVADTAIRDFGARMMRGLGLRHVFSMDLRIEADDTVHLIEFEVCPGLPCFDFRAYCRESFGLGLADAMARAAASGISDLLDADRAVP